ncbi:MAG: hypothetical protein CVU47_07795 [Chloroflexi bacterium HGW-Chloroflexi-9]|nr:MAG: hypothetical protein CVU47_07795 [Chloroflexi bacterium HGW-Chloroflexi-9]
MPEGSYWTTRRISRRTALRGAGLGLLGITGAALIGCGGADEAATATSTAAPGGTVAPGGGATRVAADQVRLKAGETYTGIFPTPAEMNPAVNATPGGTYHFRIFDSPHMDFNRILSSTVNTPNDLTKNKLFRLVLGAQADAAAIAVEGDLVESFEATPDLKQYTLHLRKGAKFHNVAPTNGREFDSEDVKLSIERYQAGGVQKDVFADVTGIETPDAHTVVVKLSQPLGEFPQMAASWSYMDAREMIADLDFLGKHAIGTGPFIQESWAAKEGQEFVRHPDYFEEGRPYLDRVSGRVYDDDNTLQAGFITGNVFNYEAANVDVANQLLQQAKDAVLFMYKGAQGANVNGFHFQMKNPTWQDERVRRAFSMAIDRPEWAAARFGIDAEASGNGYSTGPMAWKVLHDEVPDLTTQGPWYQYNPAEAAALLTAAGYSKDNQITTELTAWYARNDWGEIMVPNLNQIPQINATFRQVDNPTAVTLLNERNFTDITNITWGPPAYAVDQTIYPWYHSKGGLNHNNVNDAAMDKLVSDQRVEADPVKKMELWREIEAKIYDQVWDVFTPTNFQRRGLFHNYVINFRQHGLGALTTYCTAQLRAVWLDNL